VIAALFEAKLDLRLGPHGLRDEHLARSGPAVDPCANVLAQHLAPAGLDAGGGRGLPVAHAVLGHSLLRRPKLEAEQSRKNLKDATAFFG
jgi:hypothetical protein